MKIWSTLVVTGGLCVLVCGAGVGLAQDSQQGGADQELAMQKWMEFMTPGAEHELLKYKVGKWTFKVEMWATPGAPPNVSTGESEMKLIMGGRYLVDTAKSSFDGMPFEGMGITGYDNLKKKFVSVWIDNVGTGLTVSEGTYDKVKKTYSYTMMGPDVAAGKYKKTRAVERVLGDDQWVMEMYDTTPDSKEFLMMKGTYTREK